ncbi:DUF2493 domain-containing protein [Chryseobacterium indologenes]|uniref:YspA cpYpsA-related SLOG domain-containing protein n=1 Tax=Chryseobacterium indologenes TaxID=253 RepID=A0A0N0IWD3_CHRID|nr:DUF2493 domain-containing protein [Chryseobacterium indologenes]KPE51242.1 hypothetical protein AOB46_11290 [Chryseobacterium indologenes]
MFKVIIAGTRTFEDYSFLKERCDYYLQNYQEIEIISGGARGADLLGERYAVENGYNISRFPANWDLGPKAGPIRNREMAEYADALIAFWDSKSKGTLSMINIAKELGLKVKIVLI